RGARGPVVGRVTRRADARRRGGDGSRVGRCRVATEPSCRAGAQGNRGVFARRDRGHDRHIRGGFESQAAPRPARAAAPAGGTMIWSSRRDRAFVEAIRPELARMTTPAPSADLRERMLSDRVAGARVILPVERNPAGFPMRYLIAAVAVIVALLA